MRVLWSLPEAAPALLRHLAAYIELAGEDLARARRELAAQVVALVVLAVGVFFAVLMGCLAVIALTWDTPHRLASICWLGGGFLLVAVVALLYRSNLIRAQSPFLGTVRREWHEDRAILERILSAEQD